MGLAVICRSRRAKTPYLVEQTGRNLYSLEELSWFVYHNICLAGRSFFNERLCQWMEKELGCGDLAKRIRKGISTETSLTNLIVAVVGASDLYDSVQLTELSDRIRAMDSMQEQERLKLQADELLDGGNVWAAMGEYRHILRMHQNSRLGVSFYARVWNNLGVCHAREFAFKEAAEWFPEILRICHGAGGTRSGRTGGKAGIRHDSGTEKQKIRRNGCTEKAVRMGTGIPYQKAAVRNLLTICI